MLERHQTQQETNNIRPHEHRDKEALALCFEMAKNILKDRLNIENLTPIEAVRLRYYVKQCYEQSKAIKKDVATIADEITKSGEKDPSGNWKPKKGVDATHFKQINANGTNLDLWNFEPHVEAAYVWLNELYDIPLKSIPYVKVFQDITDGKNYKLLEAEAKQKAAELTLLGHKIIIIDKHVDEKFKEYIKLLREKSSMP